jgi:hypothetical protein
VRFVLIFILCGIASSVSAQVPSQSEDAGATQAGNSRPDEVIAESRNLTGATDRFVATVVSPVDGRGGALWRDRVCVGVVNLQAEAARALADRVLDWAHNLGVEVGEPSCVPNVWVVATDNGDQTSRELVSARPRDFRLGVSGADPGGTALRRFQTSRQPVRWWHVSLPVDSATGLPLSRLPGQEPSGFSGSELARPQEFGENSTTGQASRLWNSSRDDLKLVIIVVDTVAFDTATFGQVSDYVAMVALAQISPDAETGEFDTILNIFAAGARAPHTLTVWDRAFLSGLYRAQQGSRNPGRNLDAVADAMHRSLTE